MIATNLEQSERLIKAGIDPSTADMCYTNSSVKGTDYTDEFELVPKTSEEVRAIYNEAYHEWDKHWKIIPSWSLSALLDVFDDKEGLAKDYGLWFCYDNGKSHCTKHYTNPIDACYEMIIWLKENKYI